MKRALAACLVLLFGVIGWWLWNTGKNENNEDEVARLEIFPAGDLRLPRGGRQAFRVERVEKGARVDVSPWVRIALDDLRVARIVPESRVVHAIGMGSTQVRFELGDLKAERSLAVNPPDEPVSVKLDPERLEVGVGTTDQFRLLACYADGTEVDVSSSAEWSSNRPDAIYVYFGAVQGKQRGGGDVHAVYQAGPRSKRWEASGRLEVLDERYVSVEIELPPGDVEVGAIIAPRVHVATASGPKRNITGSTELLWNVSPVEALERDGASFVARSAGSVRLSATFGKLRDDCDIQVVATPAHARRFAVSPHSLQMAVGEEVELAIEGASGDVSTVCDHPEVAAVRGTDRIVGLAPGVATVAFSSGGQSTSVQVAVTAEAFSRLVFDPPRYDVPWLARVPVHVFAQAAAAPSRLVRIAPEVLEWPQLPDVENIEFDGTKLALFGRRETSVPSVLTARWGDLEASADVTVVARPWAIEVTPGGNLELPVGQIQRFQVRTSAGELVEWAAADLKWRLDGAPEGAVEWNPGTLSARQPGAAVQLEARLGRHTSNAVQIKTVPQDKTSQLQLIPLSEVLSVGETGQWTLSAKGERGLIDIDPRAARFASSDPKLLDLEAATGRFRARDVGEVVVTGSHPAGEPVSRSVRVILGKPNAPPDGPPETVRISAEQGDNVALTPGVRYANLRVHAQWTGTPEREVTGKATIELEPGSEAIAIEGASIVALRPGKASLRARYRGQVSTNQLAVSVEPAAALTRIEMAPNKATLNVGESARFHARGYVGEKLVGELDDHPEIRWNAFRRDGATPVLAMQGATATALGAGTAGVTAQIGNVVSNTAEVAVAPVSAARPGSQLEIAPRFITLRVGETRRLASSIQITRDGLDVLDTASFASSDDRIASVDVERGELTGNAAGTGSLSVSAGAARGEISVFVLEAPKPRSTARRLIFDPPRITLSPGQTQELRVFEALEDGGTLDVTGQAAVVSSGPAISSLSGTMVRGEAPGETTLEARLPGIAEPATAQVVVVDDQVRDFLVEPSSVSLAPGESAALRVSAVGGGLRRSLIGHRNLAFEVSADGTSIATVDSRGRVFALQPGTVQVSTRWAGNPIGQTTIQVSSGQADHLEIHPAILDIAPGNVQSFAIYLRRQGGRRPLGPGDDVRLSIGNPAVAESAGGLRVRGRELGTTEAVATWGTHRATARVRVSTALPTPSEVVGRATAEGFDATELNDTPAPPDIPTDSAPAARGPVERLQFSSDRLKCIADQVPRSLTVFAVDAAGQRLDVSLAAQFQLTPESPLEVAELTAESRRIVPKSRGTAYVHATYQGVTTSQPLSVEVAAPAGPPRLRVTPNPLPLAVGETRQFERVEVVFPAGEPPLPVEADITSNNPEVVSATGARLLARQPGIATLRVRVKSSQPAYRDLETTAVADVQQAPMATADMASQEASESRPRLVLSGPDRTTVHAQIRFAVDLVQGARSVSFTEKADIVVTPISENGNAGAMAVARVAHGGLVTAHRPGLVQVQARYRDLVSNPRQLRIDPVAEEFTALRLEIDERPMRVGESRAYRVWGTPVGAETPQDITGMVGTERGVAKLLVAVSAPERLTHLPPRITGNEPGAFEIRALCGNTRSNRVRIDVVQHQVDTPTALTASPSRLTLRVGDTVAAPRTTARFGDDFAPREVRPEWNSENGDILRPSTEGGASFLAAAPGNTRLVAQWNGLTTAVDVTVAGTLVGGVDIVNQQQIDADFTVTLQVRGAADTAEYRLVRPDIANPDIWKGTSPPTGQTTVRLTSPQFHIQLDRLYQLVIEARDTPGGQIERFPFVFRFRTQVPQEPAGGTRSP